MPAKVLRPVFQPKEFTAALAQRAFSGEKLSDGELTKLMEVSEQQRERRLKLEKEAEGLKHIEVTAQQVVIQQMRLQAKPTFNGKEIKETDEPHVKDWTKFYAYILKTKDFSLLERRPGKAAIRERWDNNEDVPGIEKFPVPKLVNTK